MAEEEKQPVNSTELVVANDPLGFNALTAAFERCVQAGWTWHASTQTLRCPRDSQLTFAIDLKTRQLSVSPKLARRLAEGLSPHPEVEAP